MRALRISAAYGQPAPGDVPIAEVGEDAVLIRAKAAGLNPVDNILAAGAKSGMVPHEYVDSLGDAADADSEVLVNFSGNSLEQIPSGEVKEASGVSFTTTGPDEDTSPLSTAPALG